ncbi:hypothetical protein LTR85_003941 [Meristemomyces frigidus]|nr:hypothetical protein LTR85_003941 [Meristemomyces frigidus]
MRFTSAVAVAPLVAAAAAFTPASTSGTDKLAAKGLINLAIYEVENYKNLSTTCNTTTGYVRMEWSSLSSTENTEYIDAVLCLQSKEAISGSIAPGAQSRYDDFVATHINQTLTIHGTGNFLTWHRYFTWTYEHALRNECGYTGYQPYLNWGKYALDPLDAPVFDGSATSMSGNGVYRNESDVDVPYSALPEIVVPAGVGGGCVETGPFANMSVNLGPLAGVYSDIPANPQSDGLGYNPQISTDLITDYTDITDFQTVMQGLFAEGLLGVHTAGHYLVGGDPGGDLFTSPGEPYFYLHHAQIDRTYWIWQNHDLAARQNAIGGTITLDNDPPSRNTTLEDTIDLGVSADAITIASAMSTLDGPFCYIYA